MKISIVHISDLHFVDKKENHILNFVDEIVAAICSRQYSENIFIIVTGDIANSGLDIEYNIANDFFENIQNKLYERTNTIPTFITLQGNHDCDFTMSNQARELLINNIQKIIIEEKTYNICNEVQLEYKKFEENSNSTPDELIEGIGYAIKVYNINGYKIAFRLHNSAWMSKIKESSDIRIPIPELPINHSQILLDSDLSIGAMHHTLNWIESSCSRKLRADFLATCDLVLSGHEHESSSFAITDDKARNEYVEGSVMQFHSLPDESGFNLICLDIKEKSIEIHPFTLKNKIYQSNDSKSRVFARNTRRLRKTFSFSKEMEEKLEDPEIVFKHPHKDDLTISDLFVFPECQKISLPGIKKTYRPIVDANTELLEKSPLIYFAAPEKSGKTTLAKVLFQNLHSQGIIPIYVKAKDIKKSDDSGLLQHISSIIAEQYSKDATEKFLQLKNSYRAIIIDDYELLKIKGKSRELLLQNLIHRFDKIIIFGHNDSRMNELYKAVEDNETYAPTILSFEHYEILEFGPVRRGELINKWLYAGNNLETDKDELHRKSINIDGIISLSIGKNIIPSYPLFVLLLIQQIDSKDSKTTSHGAQGYLYESLITIQLLENSRYEANIDIKIKYLTDFAFLLYENNDKDIDIDELQRWHIEYCRINFLKLNFEELKNDLIRSKILTEKEGSLKFLYPYIRYYFTARNISENIVKEKYKIIVSTLTRELHKQESSNILMFISYLCKDNFVLDTLVDYAKTLFYEEVSFDFNEPPKFLKIVEFPKTNLVLESINPSQARRDELKRVEEYQRDPSIKNTELENIDEQIDCLNSITSATKTIEILGQILRSYPGSLSPNDKVRIPEECYKLGLRVISFYINFMAKHEKDISNELIRIASNFHPECSRTTLEKETKSFIFELCGRVSFGMVKQISGAVGLEDLSPAFDKILEDNYNNLSYKIIDISIKLDHY